MNRKLSSLLATIATAVAFSAGTAHAQISGSTGGDIVAPVHVLGHSPFALGDGTNGDATTAWLTGPVR